LALATGDRVRLFRKTAARIEGRPGFIGSNGDIVEITGWTERGVTMRNADGQEGEVEWRRLKDARSDRLLLGFGHALTVDAAQGITAGEHINALPRGTAGITAFKAYTAESRHVTQVYTMVAEAAVFEAVKRSRALGEASPITSEHLWDRVAEDMSQKSYKALGIDLVDGPRRRHEEAVEGFMRCEHLLHSQEAEGRRHGIEARAFVREKDAGEALKQQFSALDAALARNGEALTNVGREVESVLLSLREQADSIARRGIKTVLACKALEEAPQPAFRPSPY